MSETKLDNMLEEKRPSIAAVIITKNEAQQIAACLDTLQWVDEIIIVDDCSTDDTFSIATSLGAKVIVNERISFAKQRNLGADTATSTWVLQLDADERVDKALQYEILQAIRQTHYAAFRIPYRQYWLGGRELRFGGWGTRSQVRLSQRDKSEWEKPIHEMLQVEGETGLLENALHHFVDGNYRKRLTKSNLYSSVTAEQKFRNGQRFKLWKLFAEPTARAVYSYFWLQGFRDGLLGLFWSLHQFMSHVTVHIKLWELEQADFSEE